MKRHLVIACSLAAWLWYRATRISAWRAWWYRYGPKLREQPDDPTDE